ncbi:hypothetical protein GOV07_01625 [Candidatus Woesearchaeota archaeon]|nr:hypothetical protein [Candidatus Woesearchaeota archaeon]
MPVLELQPRSLAPVRDYESLDSHIDSALVINAITDGEILSIPSQKRGIYANLKLLSKAPVGDLLVGYHKNGVNHWVQGVSFTPDLDGEHDILGARYAVNEPGMMIAIKEGSFMVQDPHAISQEEIEKVLRIIAALSEGAWEY